MERSKQELLDFSNARVDALERKVAKQKKKIKKLKKEIKWREELNKYAKWV